MIEMGIEGTCQYQVWTNRGPDTTNTIGGSTRQYQAYLTQHQVAAPTRGTECQSSQMFYQCSSEIQFGGKM